MVLEDRHFCWNCGYMHATFLLLLGWIALSHWMQYQTLFQHYWEWVSYSLSFYAWFCTNMVLP
jgi:hypothetical protein